MKKAKSSRKKQHQPLLLRIIENGTFTCTMNCVYEMNWDAVIRMYLLVNWIDINSKFLNLNHVAGLENLPSHYDCHIWVCHDWTFISCFLACKSWIILEDKRQKYDVLDFCLFLWAISNHEKWPPDTKFPLLGGLDDNAIGECLAEYLVTLTEYAIVRLIRGFSSGKNNCAVVVSFYSTPYIPDAWKTVDWSRQLLQLSCSQW